MVKREVLMESLSSNLNDFLKKTSKNLSLPDKKFLRDSFIGLLRAGYPKCLSNGTASAKSAG
jgi:predicted ATP-dependent Lon-type protease